MSGYRARIRVSRSETNFGVPTGADSSVSTACDSTRRSESARGAAEACGGFRNLRKREVEMRHGADAGAADGVDQDPFLFRRVDERGRVGDVREQDVRLRGMPGKRNALRELSGALVVLGEPLQMMVERVHARSG